MQASPNSVKMKNERKEIRFLSKNILLELKKYIYIFGIFIISFEQ